jgi:spoIIIJ-associated protein
MSPPKGGVIEKAQKRIKFLDMVTKQDSEKIKKIIEEFIGKMTFSVEVEMGQPQEETIPVNLKLEEPSVLIGDRGQTLSDIQHLLKMIIRKKIEAPIYIDLDIQDYKKKKEEYLKDIARSAADEVTLNKKEKILEPMSSYERRIIHMALADREGVSTESVGEREDRRVVIKPSL